MPDRRDDLTPSPIRVALADGHAFMRHCLRVVLEDETDIEVVSEAATMSNAVSQLLTFSPDVLVIGNNLLRGSKRQAIKRLQDVNGHTEIVVAAMEDDPRLSLGAFDAGALGYVLKDVADDDLPEAVRLAACGKSYLSGRLAERLQPTCRLWAES